MKKLIILSLVSFVCYTASSQFVYKIKADSLLVTNDSCTAELNLENSTKNVLGFLYNKGKGRTEFRKVLQKVWNGTDSIYLVGGDPLIIPSGTANISAFDGLLKIGNNLYLGNTISGSGSHNFTANRYQYLNGNFYSIGGTARDVDSFPVFRFYDNGDFTSKTTMQYSTPSPYKNGIRFNARMGYLQVGLSSIIDTTLSNIISPYETSAIILNTDSRGNIAGQLQNAFIGAYNVQLPAGKTIRASMLTGGSFFLGGNLAHVIGGGVYHTISGSVNGSLIMGNSQQITRTDNYSGWFGIVNQNLNGYTYGNVTGGAYNKIGAAGQLTVGNYLTNRSHNATALGNGNVDFTSLPYNSWDSIYINNTHNIEGRYLLFSLGNSSAKTGATKSNAMSVLYNGRTQINTTGFNNNLSEADVTPKAALDIVSTNSGVLLPRLTNTQRSGIAGADLHNGLLLYNTDSSLFQYYNGSNWKSLVAGGSGSGSGWSLTGNSGTSSVTNFLGTKDNVSLRFRTNDSVRAVIDSFGKVGINTTSPQTKFHVNGTTRFDLGSDATGDIFYRAASGQFTRLPAGSANQVLAMNSGLPAWTNTSRLLAKRTTATSAIANTETQVVGTTIAANTLAVGDIIRLTAYGIQTQSGTASTSVYRFRIGATTLTGNVAASSSWVNGNNNAKTNIIVKVSVDILITAIGSGGTVIGQVSVDKGFVSATTPVGTTAAVAVNTTVSNIAEFTFISGAASTTNTFHTATIEIIKN